MQSVLSNPSSMAVAELPSDPSDWELEEDDDEGEEETNTVSSPTGFKYNISRLSPRTRRVVKGLFNQSSSKDPPHISLELCGVREEDSEGSGLFYAFQMHEVVPCSVRIGARDSGRFSTPKWYVASAISIQVFRLEKPFAISDTLLLLPLPLVREY